MGRTWSFPKIDLCSQFSYIHGWIFYEINQPFWGYHRWDPGSCYPPQWAPWETTDDGADGRRSARRFASSAAPNLRGTSGVDIGLWDVMGGNVDTNQRPCLSILHYPGYQ